MLRRTIFAILGVLALLVTLLVLEEPGSAAEPPRVPNPALHEECGLDLALVFDLSGSIGSTDFTTEKNAGKGVADALAGTPSNIGVYSFASGAPAAGNGHLSKTSVLSNTSTVKNYIDGLNKPTNSSQYYTNWHGGFRQIQTAKDYDVVLFITDGNPTAYYNSSNEIVQGTSGSIMQTALEQGMVAANTIKGHGTRIITLGINSSGGAGVGGLNKANLMKVSGDVEYDGTNARTADLFTSGNWSDLGGALNDLATATCQGTVTVIKQLIEYDGTASGPGVGWTFGTSTPGVGVQGSDPVSQSGQTGTDGSMNFTVDYSSGETVRAVTIAETQQPGHSLVVQEGSNARCTSGGQPTEVANSGTTGFEVDVAQNAVVSCVVINKKPAPPVVPETVQVTQPMCVAGDVSGAAVSLPPDTDAIGYSLAGTPAPGSTVTVTASLKDSEVSFGDLPAGWSLSPDERNATFEVVFDDPDCVFSPEVPSVTQPMCVAGEASEANIVLPPDTDAVGYSSVGTPAPGATVTVTATLTDAESRFGDLPDGWVLDEQTGAAIFEVVFDDPDCVFVPEVPSVTQPMCVADRQGDPDLVMPEDTADLTYAMSGTLAAGETVTVTAILTDEGARFGDLPDGWVLDEETGTASFDVTFDDPECGGVISHGHENPPRPTTPPAPLTPPRHGVLARTGLETMTPLHLAVALIGVGAVLVGASMIGRRRRWNR